MHDNASPLTAAHSTETLWKPKCDEMAHPPYSPNLTLSDCQLLSPLKVVRRDRQFILDQEVKEVVHVWLAAEPKGHMQACALKSKVTMYNY
jgi:hypothetical protein